MNRLLQASGRQLVVQFEKVVASLVDGALLEDLTGDGLGFYSLPAFPV